MAVLRGVQARVSCVDAAAGGAGEGCRRGLRPCCRVGDWASRTDELGAGGLGALDAAFCFAFAAVGASAEAPALCAGGVELLAAGRIFFFGAGSASFCEGDSVGRGGGGGVHGDEGTRAAVARTRSGGAHLAVVAAVLKRREVGLLPPKRGLLRGRCRRGRVAGHPRLLPKRHRVRVRRRRHLVLRVRLLIQRRLLLQRHRGDGVLLECGGVARGGVVGCLRRWRVARISAIHRAELGADLGRNSVFWGGSGAELSFFGADLGRNWRERRSGVEHAPAP